MTETEKQNNDYGFRLEAVSEALMVNAVRIYQETIGKSQRAENFIEQVGFEIVEIKDALKKRGFEERRLGGFLYDSKLQISTTRTTSGLFYFKFNPNLSPEEQRDEELVKKADNLKNLFTSKINEFLQGSNFGVPIPN